MRAVRLGGLGDAPPVARLRPGDNPLPGLLSPSNSRSKILSTPSHPLPQAILRQSPSMSRSEVRFTKVEKVAVVVSVRLSCGALGSGAARTPTCGLMHSSAGLRGVRGGLSASAACLPQHGYAAGSRPSKSKHIPAGPGSLLRRAAGEHRQRGATPSFQFTLAAHPSGSYRDALLCGAETAASTIGKAKSIAAAPKPSRRRKRRRRKTSRVQALEPPP